MVKEALHNGDMVPYWRICSLRRAITALSIFSVAITAAAIWSESTPIVVNVSVSPARRARARLTL